MKFYNPRLGAVPPEDLKKRGPVQVRGNAVTSRSVAFQAGFKAALAGKSIEEVNYSDPVMVDYWQRGYRAAKK